jgi:hypothetical protein
MQSRQINFFHLASDIKEILNYFKESGYLIYRHKTFNTVLSEIIVPEIEYNSNLKKVVLIRPEYQEDVTFKFIDTQGYYLLNSNNICVIEFDFCQSNSKEIKSGRLFYQPKYFINEDHIEKDKNFITHSNNLYKSFKQKFLVRNDECKTWYVTKDLNIKLVNKEFKWGTTFNSIITNVS